MIKILIVDDHPLVGDGITTMLKGEDYRKLPAFVKRVKKH